MEKNNSKTGFTLLSVKPLGRDHIEINFIENGKMISIVKTVDEVRQIVQMLEHDN